jgi:hypothetical protein
VAEFVAQLSSQYEAAKADLVAKTVLTAGHKLALSA